MAGLQATAHRRPRARAIALLVMAALGGCDDLQAPPLRATLDSMLRKPAAEMPRYLPQLLAYGGAAIPALQAEHARLGELRAEVARLSAAAETLGRPDTAKVLSARVDDVDAARLILAQAVQQLRSR